MKKYKTTNECTSWNCCDKQLKSCIERSEYVSQIRRELKKKKLNPKKLKIG